VVYTQDLETQRGREVLVRDKQYDAGLTHAIALPQLFVPATDFVAMRSQLYGSISTPNNASGLVGGSKILLICWEADQERIVFISLSTVVACHCYRHCCRCGQRECAGGHGYRQRYNCVSRSSAGLVLLGQWSWALIKTESCSKHWTGHLGGSIVMCVIPKHVE